MLEYLSKCLRVQKVLLWVWCSKMNDADYDLGYFEGIRNALWILMKSKDIEEFTLELQREIDSARKLHIESRSDLDD